MVYKRILKYTIVGLLVGFAVQKALKAAYNAYQSYAKKERSPLQTQGLEIIVGSVTVTREANCLVHLDASVEEFTKFHYVRINDGELMSMS